MGMPVVSGAQMTCTMGVSPSTLVIIPRGSTVENRPVATVMDHRPYVNILPFGLCASLTNPITAAQTSAALGVLTPGTCMPVIPLPWVPGAPGSLVNNEPMLTAESRCTCAYGGVVSIAMPGISRTATG